MVPSPWERRSFLRGMRQGGTVAREMSSGNQVRVGQWGATSRTCSSSSLSLHSVCGPDTEDNDRVRHPQTENDRNQKDTDETASWKRRDRPWFALLEFALSVEVPRGIADERDSADRTVTPTGNKTKMNGFVEISTLLIHSAPEAKI